MNAIIDQIQEKAAKIKMLNSLKIDQVAIATKDAEKLISTLINLGLTEWTKDEVVAKGFVHCSNNKYGENSESVNKARLLFNYQMGMEFEVLEYLEGPSWHDEIRKLEGGAIFISHIGFHLVDDEGEPAPYDVAMSAEEKLQDLKIRFTNAGYKIAQEVWTQSHTNEKLVESKRKYHYVIFDTREEIGFDVKLIVRVENA